MDGTPVEVPWDKVRMSASTPSFEFVSFLEPQSGASSSYIVDARFHRNHSIFSLSSSCPVFLGPTETGCKDMTGLRAFL